MLPRVPRCVFQRSLGRLAKYVMVSSTSNDLPLNTLLYRRHSTISSRLLHCNCGIVTTHLFNKNTSDLQQCRYKSTKPQTKKDTSGSAVRERDNEVDENASKTNNKLDDEDEPSNQVVVSSESSKIQLHRKAAASSDELIIQRTAEEEEKSRRRYEKADPPEEERHEYHKQRAERSVNKALMKTDMFDNMKEKNKENFLFAVELFEERDVHLRGHVEFIYAALKEMKKFGVHRDLETYKKIIDIFPKGKMIQTNMFQVEFMHYPKQQQCAIDVLEQMEDNSVIPDTEVQQMLTNIFGSWSFPMRKASRMLYWMPKFKHLSPWRLPENLPDNTIELAKIAVERMTSVDLNTKITIYDCAELEDAYDITWIVSGQSPEQQKLIESHPAERPIFVEGAFRLWLKDVCMNYFILRAEPKPRVDSKKDLDEVGDIHTVYEEEFIDALETVPTVHEQEDGVILGVCCTGSSSRDSVVSWIRFLEQTNPRLGKDISVLFTLKSPIGPTDDLEILAYRDIEELQKLGKQRDPFIASSKLGVDPGMPDLRQVGIWTDSDTKFPNWPHNFHNPDSTSLKNKMENEQLLQELERRAEKKPQKIGDKDETKPDENKQIG
ncbi:Evolutionarily conserved signaling intermediate in Toll pathway, mitochondrial [Orchesella cincta]|uniref:Evolutionarily conserved signaling intermediate in Toll pathway, mitochondrial n=1 Tax=Orchesella cincta TaxID=48709 RepID=A0A1D2MR97_ORCCI|nr:Evolutionarily conserved signaling intermediate in Toll pathway, mitochondrial [Orchesella cincta]